MMELKDNCHNKKPNSHYIKNLAITGLLLASLITGINCKKDTPFTPDPKPPGPDPEINLNFTVYNHTQGQLGNFAIPDVEEGTWHKISTNYIRNKGIDLSTVESRRMAIRRPNFGELLYTTTGQELSIRAPSTKTDYDIFLFNNTNGADYNEMDAQGAHMRGDRHHFKTYRRDWDGQTGDDTLYPERVWTGNSIPEIGGAPGAMIQVDAGMKPEKVPFNYGSLFASPTPISGASFGYGYGNSGGNDGAHWGTGVTVNANKLGHNVGSMVSIGTRETLENILNVQNLNQGMVNQAIIRPSMQDRLCYVLVMTE